MSDPRDLLGPALAAAIEALVDARVEAALAERLAERDDGRWLTGARAAAEYLGCSPKRIYARLHELPHGREGGRLVFDTRCLDEQVGVVGESEQPVASGPSSVTQARRSSSLARRSSADTHSFANRRR